ncbi:UNVERIFIED_CONTAM: hypothetical protein Sangu_1233300 [Sesamum angustifolium]|uniref:Uncharacterized protein n=1 Tax=Sesamum angustifolium TaxID=2727405 RepID=A0AAW2NIC4_9LAMI
MDILYEKTFFLLNSIHSNPINFRVSPSINERVGSTTTITLTAISPLFTLFSVTAVARTVDETDLLRPVCKLKD